MKLIWLAVIYLIVATSALAEPVTVPSLRQAVAERDFEAVDARLSQAQSAYLDGALTAEDMRALFVALSRSDPQMVSFVADWLEGDPNNAKAQIARAWSIYNAAGFVRAGQNGFSYEVAQDMYDKVYDLAYTAYLTEPDLIPASDAMLRGFAYHKATTYFSHTALDAVLTKRPNWGSVLRSMHRTTELSAGMTRKYCAMIKEYFPDTEAAKIEHRCLMTAATTSGRKALLPYVESNLWDTSDQELTVTRLKYFLTGFTFADATDEQMEWAKNLLLTYPINQFELILFSSLAYNLETKMRSRHGYSQFFSNTFANTRLPLAQEYLAQDPYNLDLINIVERGAFSSKYKAITNADNTTMLRSDGAELTSQQRTILSAERRAHNADLKRQRLRASPYHSGFWLDYAKFVGHDLDLSKLFAGDAAMQNAIIYSDDPAWALSQAITAKQFQYMKFGQYDLFTKDKLSQMPQWEALKQNTNVPNDLLCPYLRARVLHDKVCEYYPENTEQCGPTPDDAEPQSIELHARAMKAPECAGLLNASIEDLWYTEVPFSQAVIREE